MKELLNVIDGMERALNSGSEPYETFPSQPTYLGGIVVDDATIRLRTGSISSNRSRSNSVIGRERSRQGSISQ